MPEPLLVQARQEIPKSKKTAADVIATCYFTLLALAGKGEIGARSRTGSVILVLYCRQVQH